ncbi:MAG: amidohydrolase family protein [Pedobacter sp.]|uniref:amidohydrolase family protein n=1 Tax=Pedobacter sp. TaxID=1411316 RepID=UPI0033954473
MVTIDSHQHFWIYDPVKHDWIGDDMAVIRRDFLPADLEPVLQENEVQGCVAVQADQTMEETDFLLALSDRHDVIKGVVGWADLQSPAIEETLSAYAQMPALKGFRHILQGEKQRDLCLQPAFLNGISLLEKYNFSYDILILQDQLRFIPQLVSRFPNQRFVIDHLAKPGIKAGEISDWKRDIGLVAKHENVHCKISGMVTEAELQSWRSEDFIPYLDVVLNAFGTKRVMYGSDWPVCLAAGNYTEVIQIVRSWFSSFTINEQELFFGKNAIDFYHL